MELRPLLFLLSSVISAQAADLKTLSIASANDYLVSRNCVKDCLWSGGGWVGSLIGCGSPYYNQCYCNANLASSATSYLSSCAIKYCTSEPDATSAVNVYAGYCSIAGYPIGEANVATQTTTQNAGGSGDAVTKTSLTIVTATSVSPSNSAGSGSTTPTPTTTNGPPATVIINKFSTLWTTITPTGTASARSGVVRSSGYSTSDKIALGVGIGFGIPATIAAIFMCIRSFRGHRV